MCPFLGRSPPYSQGWLAFISRFNVFLPLYPGFIFCCLYISSFDFLLAFTSRFFFLPSYPGLIFFLPSYPGLIFCLNMFLPSHSFFVYTIRLKLFFFLEFFPIGLLSLWKGLRIVLGCCFTLSVKTEFFC